MNGLPPLGAKSLGFEPAKIVAAGAPAPRTSIEEWKEFRRRVLGAGAAEPQLPSLYYDDSSVGRQIETLYLSFPNCQGDAFRSATRTLEDRLAKFQGNRAVIIEWIGAQDAVFANCAGGQLVLPPPPTSPDPLLRADYEYHTAAAYFYGTEYEEAARRFRQIALNESSPWQRYGRYLAARAVIRQATVPDQPESVRDQFLVAAEAELRAVLTDRRAAALHESARGLLGFIHVRLRPTERLVELSTKLEREPSASRQDVDDYRWLMDRVSSRMIVGIDPQSSNLADWIIATQTTGDEAFAHSLQDGRRRNLPYGWCRYCGRSRRPTRRFHR